MLAPTLDSIMGSAGAMNLKNMVMPTQKTMLNYLIMPSCMSGAPLLHEKSKNIMIMVKMMIKRSIE